MKLRELVTVLSYEMDQASFYKAEQGLQSIQDKAESIAKSVGNAGKKLTTFVTAPIIALAGYAAKAADDANDSQELLIGTFSKVGDAANAASGRLQNSFALSATTANELLSKFGAVFENFKLGDAQTLKLSETMVKVSADLAAFKNLSGGTAEAAEILTAAVGGQTRGLKRLGIVIDEAEIKERVARDIMNGRTFASQQQAEALATLAIIQQRASKSTGIFASKQGGLDETLNRVRESIKTTAASYGEILLPMVIKLGNGIERLLKFFNGLSVGTKKFILIAASVLAVVGPLLLGIAGIASTIGFLAQGINLLLPLIATMNVALLPLIGTALAVAAAIAVIYLAIDDLNTYIHGGDSALGRFLGWLKQISAEAQSMGLVFELLGKAIESLVDGFSFVVKGGLGEALGNLIYGGDQSFAPGMRAIAGSGGGGVAQSNSLKIEVDARGSSPTETTEAVRSGVETSLTNVLNTVAQTVAPTSRY